MQESLLADHEAAGTRDGFVFEELAECRVALNRAEEARKYYALAYDELRKDPWFARDEAAKLQRIKELGGVETKA
jgi:hypothetical protein